MNNNNSKKIPNKNQNKAQYAPVASSLPVRPRPARRYDIPHGMRVSSTELVASSIAGSVAFSVSQSLPLNPGLSGTFPWLSTIASSYERYRFRRLVFHFNTSCATSFTGRIRMAFEYDPSDADPDTAAKMGSYLGNISFSPWTTTAKLAADSRLLFRNGPLETKIIRDGPACPIENYDCGRFLLALDGQAGTSAVGELLVEYEVDLLIPQLELATPSSGSVSFYTKASDQSYSTGVAAVYQFDTAATAGRLLSAPASGVFTLGRGVYRVSAVLVCRNTATTGSNNSSVSLRKNSAAITGATSSTLTPSDGTGPTDVCLQVQAIVASDGDDTLDASVTIVGTGTLSVLSRSSLIVQCL